MSNEDKMREEFHNFELAFESDNDRRPTKFEIWEEVTKACAAIKDAEIADYKKGATFWRTAYYELEDAKDLEIASRDLLIKELRDLRIDEYSLTAHADYYLEIQRITEHHNSRALEKMLLEAELKGLENISGREWTGRRKEIKVKLAELNRNDCVCKDTLGNPLNECNECPR